MVNIEEFSKIDLRVARIVNVEDIEDSKKTYRLTVDLGEELGARTIVAGIKKIYSKEELMNRQIVCVANMDPRKVANIESQGMLLAAGDGDTIALLILDREVPNGAKVH